MTRTTYIALLQAAVIVLGFIALGVVLKFCGYPDFPGLRWNPLAVFLREHGLWLMLAPLAWTVFASKAQQVDHGVFSERVAAVIGICLSGVIILAFLYAALFPYTRPFYMGR